MSAICTAHPNIALVKYWGKEKVDEITPIHGSLSLTLSFGTTKTIAKFSTDGKNHFTLNGEKAELTKRLLSAISFFDNNGTLFFDISSENDFPTAAGCASSASGAAAFVGALASLVGKTNDPIKYWSEKGIDLSIIARKVSGSGCRSVYGGFVEWIPGEPSESIAKQVKDEHYWDDIVVFSVILCEKKKAVLSTPGMQQTVATVPWIHYRAKEVVPGRINDAKKFIEEKNFDGLADIIMRDSNELHANCLATYPPIKYLNDMSYKVIDAIHILNNNEKRNVAAYTFDAGPNPFIFTTKKDADLVFGTISSIDGLKVIGSKRACAAEGITAEYKE